MKRISHEGSYDPSVRAIIASMLQIPSDESNIVADWLRIHNPKLFSRLRSEHYIVTHTPLDEQLPPERSE